MPMSRYLKDNLRRHVFGTASFVKPGAIWIALYTTTLDELVAGTEVIGASYLRSQRNPGDANWAFPNAAGLNYGEANNISDIAYPIPQEAWGDIVSMAALDAGVAGNPLAYANLLSPRTINAGGSAPKFPAGLLRWLFS